MKSLLLKEYYTLKKQIPLFLFVSAMFSMFKGSFALYSVIYAALLPITAIAYDERSKWDTLAAAMPYTASELVLSKYIVGWISITAAAVVSTVVRKLLFAFSNGAVGESGDVLSLALPGIITALLIMSIVIPVIMKFGVEKGRLIYSLILGFCVAAIAVAGRILTDASAKFGLEHIIWAAVVILLNAASVGISVLFYKKHNRA